MAAATTLAPSPHLASRPCGSERRLPRDSERLGELLLGLEPRLVAVALRFTRDTEAARDVVQSAYEKALRHARQFRGRARVSTWLHRIVVNEALMWLRSERRRSQRRVELEADGVADLPDPSPDIPEILSRRQDAARVRRALATLRREEKEVLQVCALEGGSYAELAQRTGVHPGALKSRAFRARRQLSLALQRP